MSKSQPNSCPRFNKCSAPVCPLDSGWADRRMNRSDPTCFFILEAVKPDAMSRFENSSVGQILFQAMELLPAIIECHPAIKPKLNRASVTGSRVNRLSMVGDMAPSLVL